MSVTVVRRALVGLTIVGLAASGLVATGASAAERVVTVAGSVQKELGCADDWQPACDASELTFAGGTSYRRDFQVPAGAYEVKVTINGSWDENYGAGGVANGPNIPVRIEGPARLRFSYDDTSHVLTVTPLDLAGGAVGPQDRALAAPSLREDLTRERFYFVMADRFANGNPANDRGGLSGDRLATGYDPTDKGFYHGGDLAGIIRKLEYIKSLGTTSIWLTPSFKNRPVQGAGADVSAGYHGYWITDFTQIDPHLGTNADMTRLIDLAHAKGMKVFFDIITNHTADVIDYAGRPALVHQQDHQSLQGCPGHRLRRQDVRRRRHLPATGRADLVPVQAVLPHPRRRVGQAAGLAERPDALPQPRRLDLRR